MTEQLRYAVAGRDAGADWHRKCIDALRREGALQVEEGADVVIDFRPEYLNSPAPKPYRYGTWRFRFGNRKYPEGAPGFWEIRYGDCVTEAALECVVDSSRVIVLRDGAFPTIGWSPAAAAKSVRERCALWPALVVRDIGANNAAYLDSPGVPSSRPARRPSAWDFVVAATRAAWNAVAVRAGYLFRHEHWNVGIIRRPIASLLCGDPVPAIEWLPAPPTGRFCADPFSHRHGDATYLLCEAYDYREGLGFIAAARLTPDGAHPDLQSVLRRPFHLSYPYPIESESGQLFVPESGEANEIAAYEAGAWPGDWRRLRALVDDFAGIDATIVRHDGRYWLFATRADAPTYLLFIWHARAVEGPWTPHARNPVKFDVRSSRPAGTPFSIDGELFRPAQDCSSSYGRRVVINRVVRLTTDDFYEEPAAYVEPDPRGPYPDGLHTISAAGPITLVDGKRYRTAWPQFRRVILGYARAALRKIKGE